MAVMANHAKLQCSPRLLAATLAAVLGCGAARAQEPATKIWDIKLGTPIAALPLERVRRSGLRHQWRAAVAGARELQGLRALPGRQDDRIARGLVPL